MSTPASPFPAGLNSPVCVFCASSPGAEPKYTTAATSLGEALAAASVPVVYGGGRRGIMGVVSHSTLAAGGRVHGVLPRALVSRASEHTAAPSAPSEVPSAVPSAAPTPPISAEGGGADLLAEDHDGRLTMEVVGSMHERKAKMAKLSTGGFVVLPGGFGTFEELMEMVTWNQVGDRTAGQRAARGFGDIGMHALPVIVLNIGNFYTPVKQLIANGVRAGFISAKNAQLVQIVDLGDEEANDSEERAAEWGPLAVKALKEWTFPTGAGYGFKWEEDKQKTYIAIANATSTSASTSAPATAAAAAASTAASSDAPYLFSSGRYTTPIPPQPVTTALIPLWERHVARLRTAHAHFAAVDTEKWGTWVGDDAVWAAAAEQIEKADVAGPGDYRLRLLVRPGPIIEAQLIPMRGPPFAPLPPTGAGAGAASAPFPRPRPLFLDPRESPAEPGTLAYRQHKTAVRGVYESAAACLQGVQSSGLPEVLLHAGGKLLEGATSNVAIERNGVWVTPGIGATTPVLAGTMRAHLLATGVVVEGQLTTADWEDALAGKCRVIAFNGVRGVWEAQPRVLG